MVRLLVLVCILAGVGPSSFATSEDSAKTRRLRVGIEGKYFPDNFCGTLEAHYDCKDGQTGIIKPGETTGDINGFDLRIAESVCEVLGGECEYKVVPWDGIFKRTDIDLIIAAASRVPERIQSFGPTSIRYSTIAPIRFVAKTCWNSYEPSALTGKTLMVQTGTTYHNFLKTYYEPAGVNIVAVGTAQEIMDAFLNPSTQVDGALIGFNGLEADWVLEHGFYVIHPGRTVHSDFEPGMNSSHIYFNKKRMSKKQLEIYRDKTNQVLSDLWAASVTTPDEKSVIKFERDFQRGFFHPSWEKIVAEDCQNL